jgi:hypothetical protein
MLKKMFVASVAVAVGLFVLSHTRMASYGGTAWNKIRETTKNQVPVEFEIERIKHEIAQLTPDIKKNLSILASEIVAVEELKDQVTLAKTNLTKQRESVRLMKDALKDGTELVSWSGRRIRNSTMRDKVAIELAACQRCEKEIENKEQLLEAKERALDIARQQLAEMRSQKDDLEVQVANLETEVKTIRLAQTRSKFQIDDSRLAHIKGSLNELKNRLKVEDTQRRLFSEFGEGDEIPSAPKTKTSEQVIREVEAYLGDKADIKVAGQ